ncbi:hypothetical protein QUB60_25095 [Microcoleus sp. A2-C5]
MVPVELAVIFPNAVVLPTAPLNVTLPVVPSTVKSLLPSTVSLKVTPLPARMGLLATVTASP